MRRIAFIIALLMGVVQMSFARTTYIASYKAAIYFEKDGKLDSITTITPELSYDLYGGEVTVTILQDLMDKDRVKSIKRAKAAAGWADWATSAKASTYISSRLRNSALDNYNGNNKQNSKSTSSDLVEELQSLPINLLVENNTDKEIYINDTFRGFVYYVRPHSVLTFPLDNPIITDLRIAYAYPELPQPEYITIKASNESRKWTIDWEDDDIICFHKNSNNNVQTPLYFIQDKNTYDFKHISTEEQEALYNEHKDSIKAFEKAQDEAEKNKNEKK